MYVCDWNINFLGLGRYLEDPGDSLETFLSAFIDLICLNLAAYRATRAISIWKWRIKWKH
jgi:hypothetical protein